MSTIIAQLVLMQDGYPPALILREWRTRYIKDLAITFGLDNNYPGQLARSGKIEATKRGAFWYASREAIQNYLREVQEQPRGRPRKSL